MTVENERRRYAERRYRLRLGLIPTTEVDRLAAPHGDDGEWRSWPGHRAPTLPALQLDRRTLQVGEEVGEEEGVAVDVRRPPLQGQLSAGRPGPCAGAESGRPG